MILIKTFTEAMTIEHIPNLIAWILFCVASAILYYFTWAVCFGYCAEKDKTISSARLLILVLLGLFGVPLLFMMPIGILLEIYLPLPQ